MSDVNTIDMQAFCDPESRSVDKPYHQEGYLVATDRRILIRVKQEGDGDSQWIEYPLPFCDTVPPMLCRWSPMYDDDTPPDRVMVSAKTRADVLTLLAALTPKGKG
jgi:hypothetical protein